MIKNTKLRAAIMMILAVALPTAVITTAFFLISNLFKPTAGNFYFSAERLTDLSDAIEVKSDIIKNYTSKYSDAVSDYYKNGLNDTEVYIYNAAAYACDNGYCCIYLPEDVCKKPDMISDAVIKLSCDNPMLEHNFTENGTFYVDEIVNPDGKKLYHFELMSNNAEDSAKKQQAYEAAKDFVANIPAECDTDYEKAEYIYDFLAGTIKYDTDYIGYDTVPIYDAMIQKATVCDGFSDSFTMLFNLAGIDAFSVKGTTERGVGHVINAAKIGEDYYYFDSTADSSAYENGYKGRFYFCMELDTVNGYFSPARQFIGMIPASGKSITNQFTELVTAVDDEQAGEIVKLIEDNGCALVTFIDSITDEHKDLFTKKLVALSGKSVSHAEYNGITGYIAA